MVGCNRICSHSVRLSRPGLLPDAGAHRRAAEVVQERRQAHLPGVGQPQALRRLRRELGDPRRVAQGEGRPEVAMSAKASATPPSRSGPTRRTGNGSASSTAAHGSSSSRRSSVFGPTARNASTAAGSNMPPERRSIIASAARPPEAMEDHALRRRLGDAGGERDVGAGEALGRALAVPPLDGLVQRPADVLTEVEPIGHLGRHLADRAVDRAGRLLPAVGVERRARSPQAGAPADGGHERQQLPGWASSVRSATTRMPRSSGPKSAASSWEVAVHPRCLSRVV